MGTGLDIHLVLSKCQYETFSLKEYGISHFHPPTRGERHLPCLNPILTYLILQTHIRIYIQITAFEILLLSLLLLLLSSCQWTRTS